MHGNNSEQKTIEINFEMTVQETCNPRVEKRYFFFVNVYGFDATEQQSIVCLGGWKIASKCSNIC